jgi:oligopeptide transport system substrate-binding protein
MTGGRGEIGRRSRLKICFPFGSAGSSPAVRTMIIPALALAACSPQSATSPRDPNILVRIADDDAKGLDPQSYSDLGSTRIAMEQFEGLTRFSADGVAEPGLASSWRVSTDGLRWTFALRPGVKFSDGTAITPKSFEAVFERLNDPKTASPQSALFKMITAVVPLSTNQVEVRLRSPFPALPDLLAHPAMAALPLHRKNWESERPLVTSGAYRVSSWALSDHLTLEANPFWYGGRPAIAKVEWRPITDSLVALRLFQSGGADMLADVPSARLPQLKETSARTLKIAPYAGSYYYAFNTRRAPFSDARVRRALSMAVDRDWIANSLIATGVQPAWGIVPPGLTSLKPYRPDWAAWPKAARMAEAAKLLAEAGYSHDRPLRFEIRFNSDTDHRRVAVSLAAMWKELGVEAVLLNSEASLHFASLRRSDFDLARSGWIGDIPVPENYLAVHESDGGPVNYSGFANPEYDQALKEAMLLADPAARAAAMRRAESILMEKAPILPLYHYVSKTMIAPRVSGWRPNSANIHPSRTLSLR